MMGKFDIDHLSNLKGIRIRKIRALFSIFGFSPKRLCTPLTIRSIILPLSLGIMANPSVKID